MKIGNEKKKNNKKIKRRRRRRNINYKYSVYMQNSHYYGHFQNPQPKTKGTKHIGKKNWEKEHKKIKLLY